MMPCLFRSIFGFDCLGCGIQRSFYHLLSGNLRESIAIYPALIPLMLFVAVILMFLLLRKSLHNKWIYISAAIVFYIIVVQYILKLSGFAPWYDAVCAL